MRFTKRVAATSFVIAALLATSVNISLASVARDSHPTPRATQKMGKPLTAAKTFSAMNTDCAVTKSHATLNAPKVGYPDPKVPMVDRVFTLNTNCGAITFKAFGKKAPATVIAMTFLAKSGFFDHSLCHRITTASIFVLQCGDPTASGSGGPPFSYRDENLPADAANDYPAGTIAMANSGPNTNGSQFFIVYKDTYLPPSYTIWGVVTQGLDIVKKVASAGVVGGGTDGTPKQTIAIESVNVK